MSKMQLDIVTPEKIVYSDQVDMVITRAANGDIGILPKHAPLVSPLQITAVRVKKDGQEEQIAISGGFIEVRPDKVTILAQAAEFAGDIDVERAKRAKERAEERLAKSEGDLARAERALKRALNRLEVAQSANK
ncbi:F0F1 ATP synthase subunit epsilon [Thermoflavimicrobium dichotomicum]|uniref:ATP synthase epsilon chain n=1 Tax=Thermoflavimicrobium dichotomicum TaxID=46223 RepID=A0A1I3K1Q4_9BACL|nr:F0F1 ATP synthase subunit epsilon [Thermoflavimicrobium dichotomicum]SFI66422.1 F-type H+-transporting ATPase subunit epsilon [Thermoflavimicrobium dichotomicum]